MYTKTRTPPIYKDEYGFRGATLIITKKPPIIDGLLLQ